MQTLVQLFAMNNHLPSTAMSFFVVCRSAPTARDMFLISNTCLLLPVLSPPGFSGQRLYRADPLLRRLGRLLDLVLIAILR